MKILKFNSFLNEGKYDNLVGIMVDDLLEVIKETREKWRKTEKNEEKHKIYHVSEYEGTLKNVNLFLKIRRNKNLNWRKDFEIVGTAYTSDELEKSHNEFEDVVEVYQ